MPKNTGASTLNTNALERCTVSLRAAAPGGTRCRTRRPEHGVDPDPLGRRGAQEGHHEQQHEPVSGVRNERVASDIERRASG
jgi:hypothetical protein